MEFGSPSADYASTTSQYPLLVFFHGAGETTSLDKPQSDLQKIATTYGPCYFIAQGNTMEFTVNGVTHKFIVVCPQLPDVYINGVEQAGEWDSTGYAQNSFIDKISSLYRVDPTRIYLTGLSNGGYSTLGAATNSLFLEIFQGDSTIPSRLMELTPQTTPTIPLISTSGF
eukprot:Phypoly_transcript_10014.p2 GENE.Phypoly_transcript_10014~~Phypoly_transcript_10014.p2  ORF type:complete len:170 (+),score=27.00 Phypoly_transcript_10014:260-769(+)